MKITVFSRMRRKEKRHVRKIRAQKPKREPYVHVYTKDRRRWGHDIIIREVKGEKILGSLWTQHRLRVDDILVIEQDGKLYRYRVTESRPCMDPDDMYHYAAKFDPKEN